MKIITSWQTLMKYAKELGQARLSGDEERIEIAQKRHDDYVEMCLKSDEMYLGMTVGYMNGRSQ